MSKNALKLSTMVGESFEIYSSQMAKNALKLSTMVGETFEIYLFKYTIFFYKQLGILASTRVA